MTFNTQHCKNFLEGDIDIPLMARVIAESGADLVALNEMYGAGTAPNYTDQTGTLAELTGMYHYFAPAIGQDRGKPYGNGLLSRLPIVHAETVLIPDPAEKTGPKNYETRCVLKAELEGGITVLVSHFGLNVDEEQLAVQTVLAQLPKEKGIVMGDFNAEPHDPVLQPLFDSLRDTAELLPPDTLTFPSDAPIKKIDYILLTPDVQLLEAQVPAIVASDHRPIIARINL